MRLALLVLLLSFSSFASDYQSHIFNCDMSCCRENGGTVNYTNTSPYCENLNAFQNLLYEDCGARCEDPSRYFYNYAVLALSVILLTLFFLGIIWAIRWRMQGK